MIKLAAILFAGVFATPLGAFEIEQNAPSANPGEAFWTVYERQDVTAAERKLEELRQNHPTWTPSLELLNALDRLRARHAILSASRRGDVSEALNLYDQRPQLQARGCDDPELRWAIARAHAELGQSDQSQTLLHEMLGQCPDTDTQAGTISTYVDLYEAKAAQAAIERLRAQGTLTADRAEALTKLANQADTDAPELISTFANAEQRVSAEQEKTFAASIVEQRSRVAANVFGWYWYRLDETNRAMPWFERSREWGVNANAIEGLTRSWLAKNQPAKAEALARPWRDQWDSVATAYQLAAVRLLDGDKTISSSAMREITEFAQSTQDQALWQALGWHHLDNTNGPPAIHAFQQAIRVKRSPKAIEGLALAHQQTGNRERAKQLIAEHIKRGKAYHDRLQPLRSKSQISEWFAQGQYARVISRIDFNASARDQKLMLAWSHYHLGNFARAHDLFTQMHEQSPSAETAEGLRQTRQLGR